VLCRVDVLSYSRVLMNRLSNSPSPLLCDVTAIPCRCCLRFRLSQTLSCATSPSVRSWAFLAHAPCVLGNANVCFVLVNNRPPLTHDFSSCTRQLCSCLPHNLLHRPVTTMADTKESTASPSFARKFMQSVKKYFPRHNKVCKSFGAKFRV
jgi:hypothetical protein